MELAIPKMQSYLHRQSSYFVSVFSPINDTVTIRCHSHEGLKLFNRPLFTGLNSVSVPPDCEAQTSQLLIFPSSVPVINGTEIKNFWTLDLANDLADLSEDLTNLHRVNLSDLAPDIAKFAAESQLEKLDLAEVSSVIKKFQVVESMGNFNPIMPDLETATPMTWSVHLVGWGMLLFSIVAIFTCCKNCICPNIACCGNVIKGFKTLLVGTFKLIRFLVCACHSVKPRAQQQAPANIELPDKTRKRFPSSPSYEEVNHKPLWETVVVGNRAFLTAQLPSGAIYFNHLTGKVENSEGNIINLPIAPSPDTVNSYLRTVNALNPPSLIYSDGKHYLADDPYVQFDKRDRSFTHTVSKKPVCGYKLPVISGKT
jgi:hypothetical protein